MIKAYWHPGLEQPKRRRGQQRSPESTLKVVEHSGRVEEKAGEVKRDICSWRWQLRMLYIERRAERHACESMRMPIRYVSVFRVRHAALAVSVALVYESHSTERSRTDRERSFVLVQYNEIEK